MTQTVKIICIGLKNNKDCTLKLNIFYIIVPGIRLDNLRINRSSKSWKILFFGSEKKTFIPGPKFMQRREIWERKSLIHSTYGDIYTAAVSAIKNA